MIGFVPEQEVRSANYEMNNLKMQQGWKDPQRAVKLLDEMLPPSLHHQLDFIGHQRSDECLLHSMLCTTTEGRPPKCLELILESRPRPVPRALGLCQ